MTGMEAILAKAGIVEAADMAHRTALSAMVPGILLYCGILALAVWIAGPVRRDVHVQPRTMPRSRQTVVNRICLAGLFFLFFLPLALRTETGNDYRTYIVRFHDIAYGNYVVTERGFNLLVRAIYAFLGEEYYLVIFTVCALLTVAAFLWGIYAMSRGFALSIYLYLALGLYFQSYNTVRYYLALGFALCAMAQLLRRQYAAFVLTVLLVALFHKTALVVLLLYPLAAMRWRRWMVAPVAVLCLSGLLLPGQYMVLLLRLYPSYVNEQEYIDAGGFSIVSLLRCLLVVGFTLYACATADAAPGRDDAGAADGLRQCARRTLARLRQNSDIALYLKLNVMALLMYACFSFIPFLSRIGYYMTVSQILLLPAALCVLPRQRRRRWTALIAAAGVVYFAAFLREAMGTTVKILPYASWLEKTGDWTSYPYIRYVP